MNEQQEVLAYIQYDFWVELTQTRVEGVYDPKLTISSATKMVKNLNDIWGDGSHWVVPLNQTTGERDTPSDRHPAAAQNIEWQARRLLSRMLECRLCPVGR